MSIGKWLLSYWVIELLVIKLLLKNNVPNPETNLIFIRLKFRRTLGTRVNESKNVPNPETSSGGVWERDS